MATNNAFKVTKDTSARKGTRVGSIQSNVEAAAMRESHEYFVSRLTEGYNKQLETMELEYEEQLRELNAHLASDVEKAKQDAITNMKTEAGGLLRAAETKLKRTQDELVQATNERDYQKSCASRAEKDKSKLESRYRSQIVDMSAKQKKQLDEAHREKNTGPYRWMEIKFIKKYKSKMAEPKFAVKRGSAKFSELVQAALNSKTTHAWAFEYKAMRSRAWTRR